MKIENDDSDDHEKMPASSEPEDHEAQAPESAGRLTRDVIKRAAGPDPEDLTNLPDSNHRQKQALATLYAGGGEVIKHHPDKVIAEGAEHIVEFSASDPSRLLKHTKEGGFGVVLQPHVAPYGSYLSLRVAAPHEYIDRVDNFNHLFGDDIRIEGVSKIGENIGIVTSQKAIKGHEPATSEIHEFMRDAGFKQIKAPGIDNAHMSDKTWFHPETGYIVSDVKPDNFKKMRQAKSFRLI